MRELAHVEEGGRARHIGQPERTDHVVEAQDLLAVGRPPSQQDQVVAHGLGQIALLPVVLEGDGITTLGQLLALLVHQHGQVGEDGQSGSAECLPHEDGLGRVGEVLLTADHVCDAHVHVVHRVG